MQDDGKRSPVSYVSRSLGDPERHYSVIAKHALAAVWVCGTFSYYVVGMNFVLETDHKPLENIFNQTQLSKTPSRIQSFRLRLMRFSAIVRYVHRKHQLAADTLSCPPIKIPGKIDQQFVEELETFASQTVFTLPATPQRLSETRKAQLNDKE